MMNKRGKTESTLRSNEFWQSAASLLPPLDLTVDLSSAAMAVSA